ncbi:MAG: zinc ribbon domain-containing protein [Anaerolineae bacterium]|nr:MAG: zinc ribbon domain-containing protein [Anaerolineae bacterium]
MTAVLVALMALGLAAAVGYPLWKGVKEDALPTFAGGLVVQDGVAYSDPDELALDRALGRVGGESPAVTVTHVDLEEELERQVAALRRQRRSAPPPLAAVSPVAATAAGDCPQCGQAYDAGDSFCVRCGVSLIQACPNCGHPYDADDLFCSRCGQTL